MSVMVASRAQPRCGRSAAAIVRGRCDERDDQWFALLYDQTFGSAYRFALSIVGDRDSAEDVVAEAYLRAWKARESCTASGVPVSWLLTITHHCALDFLRSRRDHVALDSIADPEEAGCPEERALAETAAVLIQDAIRHLTPEQRQVIFLRFYEELPHDIVAARLGRTPNAVRALQFRALSRLKSVLEGRDVR